MDMLFGAFIYCIVILTVSADNVNVEKFKVQPGGVRHDYSLEQDGIKCKFSYVSQGGTNEEWTMTVRPATRAASGICQVEREGAVSYLFFQDFTLSVTSASAPIRTTVGTSFGKNGSPLSPDEYRVDTVGNKVHSVAGKFKSNLVATQLEFSGGQSGDL